MFIVLHVCIALASLALSTVLFVHPSRTLLRSTYALVALTVASGTYVAWSAHAHILQTCLTGLFYLAAVSLGLVFANHKLATSTVKNRS